VSLAADLLLIQKTGDRREDQKDTVIPVHRDFIMTVIPYFAAQYDENGIWREGNLKDQEKYYVSNLPTTVNITSVVSYIKNLYEDDHQPLTEENCVDILELADYWCDEFMKNECLRYIEEVMDDDLFMKIFKNPRVRNSVENIIEQYVKRERSSACGICDNNRFHFFLPKKSSITCLKNSNRLISFLPIPELEQEWFQYDTVNIPRNIGKQEIRLKFQVTQPSFANTRIGIAEKNNNEKYAVSTFCGFRLLKYDLDATEAEKQKNKTLVVASGGTEGTRFIPIMNDTKPFIKFLLSDVFTLIYSKTLLTLKTDRGFSCDIALDSSLGLTYKFVVSQFVTQFNEDKGLELLPELDHVCDHI